MNGSSSARLPVSGLRLEWAPPRWRIGAGSESDPWLTWSPGPFQLQIVPHHWEPTGAPARWWVLAGTVPDGGAVVQVDVEGLGGQPAIHRLGLVWAAEWVGAAQLAHLVVGEETGRVNFRRRKRSVDQNPPSSGWTEYR